MKYCIARTDKNTKHSNFKNRIPITWLHPHTNLKKQKEKKRKNERWIVVNPQETWGMGSLVRPQGRSIPPNAQVLLSAQEFDSFHLPQIGHSDYLAGIYCFRSLQNRTVDILLEGRRRKPWRGTFRERNVPSNDFEACGSGHLSED